MENTLRNMLIVIVLLSLVGCGSTGGHPTDVSASIAQSSKPRAALPNVAAPDLAGVSTGNNTFAFDLYQALRKEKKDGNLFYSPYSISLALAMTYAGARGQTEQQMAKALHFLPQERLHPAFNHLDLELAQRGKGAKGKDGKGFRLNIVNALWGQKDHRFLPEFLDRLAEHYGAGLRLLDFAANPEASRVAINNWVSDQTESKIKDLIPQGVIDQLTRLVLTNAIYFNAAWGTPFDAHQTQDGTFHLLGGGQVTVPMMKQTTSLGYAEGQEYQAVELPYDGRELAIVILLPRQDQFETFESALDAGRVDAILKSLEHRQVTLSMPRFKVESSFELAKTLAILGMPIAFTADADFSGMDGVRDLYIGNVVHKAFVSVDESGTEAAAATAVVMRLTAMPAEQPVQVTLDRPFIFLIRDIQTDTLLFVGRVVNPG